MARFSAIVVVPLVISAGLAGAVLFGIMQDAGNVPPTMVGQPAPDTAPEPVPGTMLLTGVDLRSGEVSVVNFWASWCPPCRAEHPTLMALAAQGVRVAGINFRDEADAAVEYLAEEGDPFFATGFDPLGRTAARWDVDAPPQTFIVAGDGTVLFRFAGPMVGSDYEQRFLPQLRAAQGR